jgi:hypothetical protein
MLHDVRLKTYSKHGGVPMQFNSIYFGPYYRLCLVFSTVALLLAAAFVMHSERAQAISLDVPKSQDTIVYPPAEITQNTPVLTSLAAMYTPLDTQEHWIKSVCTGMTEGGCDYFKVYQAAAIWDEHLGNIGSSAGYISNSTVIDETHEVWTAATSIFTQGPNDKHSTETSFDVYVLVERGADQKWYLDRVLIGPSIDLNLSD